MKLSNLTELSLRKNQLITFPVEICKLAKLTRLSLSENRLTTLSHAIGNLINLTRLSLENNQLTVLPAEIGNLTNLTELILKGNQLTTLPTETENLTNLTELDLRGNPLPIPQEILALTHKPDKIINYLKYQTKTEATQLINKQIAKGNAPFLNLSNCKLTSIPREVGNSLNLTWLDLSHNQLTTFPSEIIKLTNLKELDIGDNQLFQLPSIVKLINLTELNLGDNQLTTLPYGIGELRNLKTLYLSNNQLTSLPYDIWKLESLERLGLADNPFIILPPEITNLVNLKWLDLSRCGLINLPSEIDQLTKLEYLYLSSNKLTELPLEINKLTNLKRLVLKGNPLSIPPEILELTDEPKKTVNYYLQHQINQKKPLNEAKMIIVGQGAVGKTSLVKQLLENSFDPHETKTEGIDIKRWHIIVKNTEVHLNLWDFGGQEIMHATHQFFLTKRSLYLLVLDSRLDEQENRIEYWLKIIQSFGGDSPIIVVCNKSDQHDLDLDWRGLQNKYPTIKAFAKNVSCKTGDGISDLQTFIKYEIGQLEHIYDELLLTWFAVKTQLENMKSDYVSYNEYLQMCCDEGIVDELSQQTLISFLHDLGIVLHFHDYPVLEDTNVLNPEWVTKGIYQILTSNGLFQHKGELERKALQQILGVGSNFGHFA